jgi:proton-dependent oligopeptide transporter, POT family
VGEAEWIFSIALVALGVFLCGGALIASSKQPEFAGHPRGLYMLFFAEMWERFSYYGMRALLILYLTKHWLYSDGKANLIYGAYTSLVYITPLLGGYLADKYLGQRKAVLFGGVLLAIGHLLMAFEGMHGVTDPAIKQADPAINIFWAALAFIIVGSGFLKANISVMVGQLYPKTDPRRDGAYTIFYMGINAGAAIGTILVGYLGETIGWSYGFGLAGIGMVAGLIVFVLFKGLLNGNGESTNPQALSAPVLGIKLEWLLYILGFVAVGMIWLLIQYQGFYGFLLLGLGLALLGYVMFEAFKLDPHARDRIFAALFLISLQPLFWALFEQAGGSISLFTDKFVDRGGVPTSLFQSINPIFIIFLAPLFAWLWTWMGRKGIEPSTPTKFGLAMLQMGFAFLVFVWGGNFLTEEGKMLVIFVFALYFFSTTAELCLSPVGLSAMNRLAPKHMASLIMGAWFFSTAGGNFLAGKIGERTGGESGQMTMEKTFDIYTTIGWITIGVGVFVLIVSPFIRKLMHLDTLKDDTDPVKETFA